VAIEDLYNSKQEEIDPDDMEDDDYMKKGDLAASLVQCGGKICLCVIEVTGFRFGTEKTTQTTAALDDLEDKNKQIKVTGQVIELKPSSPRMDFWNGQEIIYQLRTNDERLTHRQLVVEIPSFFIHPLAPSVVHKPPPGSLADESRYPTWRLSSKIFRQYLIPCGTHLNLRLQNHWECSHAAINKKSGCPSLSMSNGRNELFMKSARLPYSKAKHSANDKLSCHFCKEKVKTQSKRNHVGVIYFCVFKELRIKKFEKFWEQKHKQQSRRRRSRAAGRESLWILWTTGCFTNLLEKKSGNSISITVTSSCPYHYERMQYKQASYLFQHYAMHKCANPLSSLPHLCLRKSTNHLEILMLCII